MSSSNLVSVRFIEEATLGQTPLVGNFQTARFISESLSGTPGTTESKQIRSDRYASGNVVTSLEVGGDMSFELAKEPAIDSLISSAMLSSWNTVAPVVVDLTLDVTAKTLVRALGDFNVDLEVGDILTLSGFVNAENNTEVQVLEIVDALTVRCAIPAGMVDEAGGGTSYKRADKISIGTVKKSFSMEKAFLDLSNKAIVYKGMLVNSMKLTVGYGAIVSGSFGFSGTEYTTVDVATDFITNARVLTPPATTQSLNGSVDMPFISTSAVGLFGQSTFCIQNVGIDLANNLTAQNCIGRIGAKDFSPGTAQISVNLAAYLADGNWSLLQKKLSQASFAIGFAVKNADGLYGFYLPAVQVSFDDPSSGGQNQDISMDMKGVAKVGVNGESPLTIYKV